MFRTDISLQSELLEEVKSIFIFCSICNIQEKLFIQYSVQWGQIFFQCKTANFLFKNK